MKAVNRLPTRTMILLGLAGAALLFVFWDGLRYIVDSWAREEYSHGYLIPVIAAYLIQRNWPAPSAMSTQGAGRGVFLVALGLLVALAGDIATVYAAVRYGFVLAVIGIVYSAVGSRGMQRLWVPLLFLLFMIPIPQFLYFGLSTELQLISSRLGVAVIRLFGITVHLEGNVIDLGNYKLQVVEACSGLRYLFPLMSFSFLCAYLYKAPFWARLLVFVSAVPLTVLLNSLRIGIVGVLVEHNGISAAEGFMHYFEGWIIFMAAVALLFLLMWLLSRLRGERQWWPSLATLGVQPAAEQPVSLEATAKAPGALLASVALLVLAGLVGAILPERQQSIPPRPTFAEFPMEVDGWQGRPSALEQQFLKELMLDDYLLVDFAREGTDIPVNLYVAYYADQKDGSSTHSPKGCLPGGGWRTEEFEAKQIAGVTPGDGLLPVNRAVLSKAGQRIIVYYWFVERGRPVTNEYLVKALIFWDALTKGRTDGALIRVATRVSDAESVGEAEGRLLEFVRASYARITTYLPDA